MRLNRLLVLLLALLAAAFLAAGCGDDDSDDDSGASDTKTPAPLTAGGEFRVCTDVPYEPAEYIDENGDFAGFDIDIMTEVAKRLGTTAEFEKTLFDAIIPSLNSKRCDAIISSMNVTPEREKSVSFVTYMVLGQSLMVPADAKDDVSTLEDLAGLTVAVQVGTTLKKSLDDTSKALVADGKQPIDVQVFPDAGSAAAALKAGKVDVFFADSPQVADLINKDPKSFAFAGEPIDPLPVGIAVRTADTELRDAIQDAIDDMYEDGKMLEILKKWSIESLALPDDADDADGEDASADDSTDDEG